MSRERIQHTLSQTKRARYLFAFRLSDLIDNFIVRQMIFCFSSSPIIYYTRRNMQTARYTNHFFSCSSLSTHGVYDFRVTVGSVDDSFHRHCFHRRDRIVDIYFIDMLLCVSTVPALVRVGCVKVFVKQMSMKVTVGHRCVKLFLKQMSMKI